MPRTLFARLALTLTLVLLGAGLLYAMLSSWLGNHYQQEFLQKLNRDLASNLVAERQLVRDGVLDQQALKNTFHHYMMVNPNIEIYLLDGLGEILSYSAEPGKVKRRSVALEPVKAFIRGDALPLLGDDPRHQERRKVFSATSLPSAHGRTAYLYIVLRGEEYARIERLFRDGLLLKLSGTSVLVSLVFALLSGLLLFHLLTRRLNLLGDQMQQFIAGDFARPFPYPETANKDDEIEYLGRHYNRMSELIRQQLEDLKRQDAVRRELVTNVSHDLRTPLAALQGYIETLQLKGHSLNEQDRTECLQTALLHSRRLTRLVDDLFELSKLDARETEATREHFSIAELVQDILQKFSLLADQRGIHLHMKGGHALPSVCADIALIERVLENLMSNAMRHTPEGGEVVVGLQAQNRTVRIQVSDNGVGIGERDLPHVFERGYRGGSPERSGNHVGLGLSIVRQIIELHGSEISVSSHPGQGTQFTFGLPAC